jgi:hypothetical protein
MDAKIAVAQIGDNLAQIHVDDGKQHFEGLVNLNGGDIKQIAEMLYVMVSLSKDIHELRKALLGAGAA